MIFPKKPAIHRGAFGSCCDDLKLCMEQPNALIRVTEDHSLFLTIGHIETEQGPAWFEHAIIHCPFCGKLLQDRGDLRRKSAAEK